MKERGREGDATAELCPWGGTGRAGGLRPGQKRALLAGPEAHEGLGLVLGQGFRSHRSRQPFLCGFVTTPQLSSPSPG